jgi:putative endonuclease
MTDQCFWVYILHCNNDSYYTGYTTDLRKRYQSHLDDTGQCKYTRSFKPLRLAQCWQVQGDKALSMQLERTIKKLSRTQKLNLIANPGTLATDSRLQSLNPKTLKQINLQSRRVRRE